ncbi:MAG: ABC transporter permease [Defluviitaleaceae bacterium]|nr:ABC transporter permease [Defluviitaleaceae bacterium]
MREFAHIWKHYNQRMATRPRNYILYLLIPLVIILANFGANIGMGNAGDMAMIFVPASLMVLAFQYLTSEILMYNVFTTLRGKMAERLFASPVKQYTFLTGAVASSLMLNLLQSTVIMGVITIAFGVALGNPLTFFGFLFLTGIISQLLAALVAQIAKTRKAADGIYTMIVLVMFIGLEFVPVTRPIFSWATPLGLAWQGIVANINGETTGVVKIAILAGFALILATAVAIIGKRRNTI